MSAESTLEVAFVRGGERVALRFESGPVTIGRSDDCDVVVDDKSVSRHHATARLEGGRWSLHDTGSFNGIVVDGARVDAWPIEERDVGFGDVTLRFRATTVGDETVAADRQLSAIDVGDLDDVFASMLADDVGERTLAGVPTETMPLGAPQVIQILRDATDALLAAEDLDALLERVLDLVFAHLPVQQASVWMRDEGGELRERSSRVREGSDLDATGISRKISDAAVRSKQAVLVMDATEDQRFDPSESIVGMGIRSAMCAPLCHHGRVYGLIYAHRKAANAFSRTHLEVLSVLAGLSAAAFERATLQRQIERERNIRDRLARYHAPSVIDRIVASPEVDPSAMQSEEREISVLFADIAGFTPLSEQLEPRAVTELLNEVFGALAEEVFREDGTLDKFLGDAVMVFFGAPLPQADHAARAVRTGLAMQRRVTELGTRHGKTIGLRIGVNSGPAVVGDVGTPQRKDYTVIGDTVNTASRLQSFVAGVGEVVVGPRTRELLGDGFELASLPEVRLKGKARVFAPFLVVGEA